MRDGVPFKYVCMRLYCNAGIWGVFPFDKKILDSSEKVRMEPENLTTWVCLEKLSLLHHFLFNSVQQSKRKCCSARHRKFMEINHWLSDHIYLRHPWSSVDRYQRSTRARHSLDISVATRSPVGRARDCY